jgi:hypothetical protein
MMLYYYVLERPEWIMKILPAFWMIMNVSFGLLVFETIRYFSVLSKPVQRKGANIGQAVLVIFFCVLFTTYHTFMAVGYNPSGFFWVTLWITEGLQ